MAKNQSKHSEIYASLKYSHAGEFPANPAWSDANMKYSHAGHPPPFNLLWPDTKSDWHGLALLALLIALRIVGVASIG
ncbi:hypothetical protein GF380_03220 [Candidatus Uhrbacteria bacterium]|nr:hypothetical protein [Candidatus Uhrbacteria bacterium]